MGDSAEKDAPDITDLLLARLIEALIAEGIGPSDAQAEATELMKFAREKGEQLRRARIIPPEVSQR